MGLGFVGVQLAHVQDEAELRLLSGDRRGGPAIPRRGRVSKVQVNVMDLLFNGKIFAIPTDLQALGNKAAQTQTTCFDHLVRYTVGPAATGGSAATGGPSTTVGPAAAGA